MNKIHQFNWEERTWDVIDNYFRNKERLVKHQIESYNFFVDQKMQEIINEFNPIVSYLDFNQEVGKYLTEYHVEFGDLSISKPIITEGDSEIKVMYPKMARLRNLTYSSVISCDIKQRLLKHNPKTGGTETIELTTLKNVHIGKLPIMLKSKYCILNMEINNGKAPAELGECEYDEGGYFIVNGSEKVIVCFERKCDNKIFVFPPSKGPSSTYSHIAEVTSVDHNKPAYAKQVHVKLTAKDIDFQGRVIGKSIRVQINRIRADGIPLFILFRALGVISDRDIMEKIVYNVEDEKNSELMNLLLPSLEESSQIQSKKIALEFIAKYISISATVKNQPNKYKLKYTEDLLLNELLPHVGRNPVKKAYYVGLMVRKLLFNYLGYIETDDRDSFINKRVETPGVLLETLFRANFNKLVKDLKNSIDKDIKNGRIDEVSNSLNKKIKVSTIENNMKYALATGNWGLKNQPNKKGVAQVLSRLSYLSSLSHRRRVIAPIERSGKQTAPRKLHNTQFGTICITGDTEILLADGITVVRIDELDERPVMTVNPDTLEESPSRIYSSIKLMPDKLLKIVTINGRSIKCTLDHPLLVNRDGKNEWVNAGDLKVDDNLIVRNTDTLDKERIILSFGKVCESIESIGEIEPEFVYDFTTVSCNSSFIANGIVSHNCPCETPEGASIGIVKNLALMTHITLETSAAPIIECLSELEVIPLEESKPLEISQFVKVFVNGDWKGMHKEPQEFVKNLRKMRRTGMINIYTSIAWKINLDEIHINTDAGRLSRPLYIVENNDVLITNETAKKLKREQMHWDDLLVGEETSMIEYIDTEEEDTAMIAMTYENLRKNKREDEYFYKYTHCEIHQAMMLGVVASNIPFPTHNQSPRNLYQGAQGKQAIGIYATNYNERMDTIGHILHYPQKPLVNTRPSAYVNSNELPAGQNAIVAIACYTGYNQEDSLIMNLNSVERGLFLASSYRTYKDEEKRNQSILDEERFCKPDKFYPNGKLQTRSMRGNYDKLGNDGFVKVGSYVSDGDVIIGKVIPSKTTLPDEPKYKDNSTVMKGNEEGVVDKVYSDKNGDGYKFCKVRVRTERDVMTGDKFSSRHGQKGTVGILYPQEDMPYTKDGLVPDLIINPHAIPKRMTIGQLIECVLGKACSLNGYDADATIFNNIQPEQIEDILQKSGFEKSGTEIMYNGKTGEQMEANIFIGPTYYYRLKHLVSDKIHSRSTGPYNLLNHAPSEGRSRDGGLRFGEMERDCMLAHGSMQFLKERMYDCSDKFLVYVCKECGMIAVANPVENLFKCTYCKNCTDFAKIELPYSAKLLIQDLMTTTIAPRLFTEHQ